MYLANRRKLKKLAPISIVCQFHCKMCDINSVPGLEVYFYFGLKCYCRSFLEDGIREPKKKKKN